MTKHNFLSNRKGYGSVSEVKKKTKKTFISLVRTKVVSLEILF